MPGAFKNKVGGALALLLFGYFLVTDPTGTAHAVTNVLTGVFTFLKALG